MKTWIGRILSGIAVVALAADALGKIVEADAVVKASVELGYSAGVVRGLGIALLVCVVAYAIPRTAVVGAVLLTGWLGGAIATHVRVGSPMLSHTLFPIWVAAVVWLGLYLRRAEVRAMIGVR